MLSVPSVMEPFVEAAVLVPYLVFCVRLVGLRSFSKMASYDFAISIAFGSVLAATVLSERTDLVQGMVAITALFAVRWTVGFFRARSDRVEQVLDNKPVLLLFDGQVLEENLAAVRVTEADLRAKLREANVHSLSDARAVVMETTGDVSVLHGGRLDDDLLAGVRRGPDRALPD